MATALGRRLAILTAALAGSVSAFTYARYGRDLRRAHERLSTGSEIVHTACGPIEYAVAGYGPTVLTVHGAGGGFDQGMEFGEALTHNGFRIIAMSWFGYLRTLRRCISMLVLRILNPSPMTSTISILRC